MDAGTTKVITGLVVEPGVVIANRYEVCERLGAGGVGMVYRAIDRELDGEVVALKLLLPHLAQDEHVFRRFRNEVLVARTLSHPNIVRTHDMGRAEGGYSYISMELVDGESLKDKLQDRIEQGEVAPSLAFEEALAVLYQVMSGVAYAHGRGVIHRDLKPANVLISKAGEVKLADFGTARIMGMDTTLTQTGQIIGTPDYMSPEQIRGEQLDTSCDIYALGIMAYELVTGERPFTADSAVAVAFKHLNDPLPPFASSRGIPLWFQEVVQKATAKKKTDRFASMMELAATMLDYAPHLSVQSTFFSVDRTIRVGALGTISQKAGTDTQGVSATAPLPTDLPQTGDQEGATRHDLRFELGEMPKPAVNDTTGEWKLGSVEPGVPNDTIARGAAPQGSGTRGRESRGRRRLAGSPIFGILPGLAIGTILIYVGLLGGIMVSGGLKSRIYRRLLLIQRSAPEVAGVLSAALLIDLPRVEPVTPGSEAVARDRERYLRELEASNGGGVSGGVVGSTSSGNTTGTTASTTAVPTIAPTSAPTPVPLPGDNVTNPQPTVAPTTVSTPIPTVAPTVAPTGTPIGTPEPLRFSGTVVFLESGKTPVDDSLSIDRLGQVRWSVSLKRESGTLETDAAQILREGFEIRVTDIRKASMLTTLKPDQVVPPKGDAPPKLSGTLGALRSKNPSAGTYRLDVMWRGDVIATKDLVLYRATFGSAGDGGRVGSQPGDTVRIVTGATAVGGELPAGGTTGTQAPAPTPNVVPTEAPQPTARPFTPVTETSGGSGLPPAAGSTEGGSGGPGRIVSVPVDSGAPPQLPNDAGAGDGQNPQNEIPAVSERYEGALKFTSPSGQEERSTITLDLEIRGSEIGGRAEISGYGQFAASGNVHARGIVIELRNGGQWIRLSSGPRGQSIRGIYSFPAVNQKGSWEVSRVR